MKFWIVTPSYNQLAFLKRCVASVADQVREGLQVHHHVQDGGSEDGTVEWLAQKAEFGGPEGYSFSYESATDAGMYDAINRGFSFHERSFSSCDEVAPGTVGEELGCADSILAYLNCDEQYLPDALSEVSARLSANPALDIISGDCLLINQQGDLLAYRKGYALRRSYIQSSHMYNLTAAIFFRPTVWRELKFDCSFQTAADQDFMLRALGAGYLAGHMRRYLSVFTFMPSNQSLSPVASDEYQRLRTQAPAYIRCFRPLINSVRLLEKLLSGAYRQRFPLEYWLYSADDQKSRQRFRSESASYRWPRLEDEGGDR
jgi:glycosyltransferase involved in cell wall biosynthesis